MAKKEGSHYKPRKTKEKELFSLRSLVPEITAVSDEHEDFETVEKRVQRIVNDMKKAEGVEKGTLKIHKDNKVMFVKITKGLYENEQLKNLQKKFSKRQELALEELLEYSNFLQDGFKEGQPEEIKKEIDDRFETMTEKKYFERLQLILDAIWEDSEKIQEINQIETKLKYMDDYIKILDMALAEWRININIYLINQEVYKSVMENNPHLQGDNQTLDEEKTAEILEKMKSEIDSLST